MGRPARKLVALTRVLSENWGTGIIIVVPMALCVIVNQLGNFWSPTMQANMARSGVDGLPVGAAVAVAIMMCTMIPVFVYTTIQAPADVSTSSPSRPSRPAATRGSRRWRSRCAR